MSPHRDIKKTKLNIDSLNETETLLTVVATFVYSDYIESVQEMYYGCVGEIS